MGHLRDIGLGLALALISLVLLEGALRATGAGEPPDTRLSRGFDPEATYFLQGKGEFEGWYRPRFWGPEQGAIPPKGERTRVLLFGGSNTKNFGERALADALDLGRAVEVVNLARNGFGSSRVKIVFDQALDLLDPDVVVIYSGHNEFIEMGFRMDLGDHWPADWVRDTAEVAMGLNGFHWLTGLWSPEVDDAGRDPTPEDWRWEYDKFLGIDYAETQAWLEAYRDNLDAMATAAEARGVRVVLSTVVYNRLAMPSSSALGPDLAPADRARVGELVSAVRADLPSWMAPLVPAEGWQRVENFDWDRGWREGGAAEPMAFLAPDQLWHMPAPRGRLAGADPLVPARAYWNPKVTGFVESLARLHRRDPSPEDQAAADAVDASLDELLGLVPDHPFGHFVRGLLLYHGGAPLDQAAASLELAGECDRAPRRGNRLINEHVRAVAAAHPDSLLFDADAAFAACEPAGLVGWRWMLDQCHLGFGGRRYRSEVLSERSYADHFLDYEAFLAPRLEELLRLLSPTGSLLVHLDATEVHYVKVMLDGLVGRENFQNEIVWAYDFGGRSKRRWAAKHDTILWYTKDPKRYHFDTDGVDRIPYMAPGLVGEAKAKRGKLPTDVWWNTIVSPTGKERLGYPTQKPLAIAERIVEAHCPPDGRCLDVFAGSGTLGAAALARGRRAVLVDQSHEAIEVMERRFEGQEGVSWFGKPAS